MIFVILLPLRASSETITYTYDTSGRVTEAVLNYGVHILYGYDATGNRLQRDIAIDTPGAGDINNDGLIELDDAVLTLQLLSGIISEVPVFIESNINSNGKIDMAEAIWILQTLSQ